MTATIEITAQKWLANADKNSKDLVRDHRRMIWGLPKVTESDFGKFEVWRTLCGRYMMARITANYTEEHRFNIYERKLREQHLSDKSLWVDVPLEMDLGGRPKDFRTLFRALEQIKKHHCERYKLKDVITNESEIFGHAVENNLAELPRIRLVTTSTNTRRPVAALDDFGSRLDSDTAKFNAVLSSKPQSMAEIQKAAGLERTYYNHVKDLIQRGLVVKEGGKYRLATRKKS